MSQQGVQVQEYPFLFIHYTDTADDRNKNKEIRAKKRKGKMCVGSVDWEVDEEAAKKFYNLNSNHQRMMRRLLTEIVKTDLKIIVAAMRKKDFGKALNKIVEHNNVLKDFLNSCT
jgi:hypothetical protein